MNRRRSIFLLALAAVSIKCKCWANAQSLMRFAPFMQKENPVLRFTITYNASNTAPVITSTLSDANFLWTRPDLTTTATKTPLAAFFNASGDYTLTCTDWSKISSIVFQQGSARNWLNTTNLSKLLPFLTG